MSLTQWAVAGGISGALMALSFAIAFIVSAEAQSRAYAHG